VTEELPEPRSLELPAADQQRVPEGPASVAAEHLENDSSVTVPVKLEAEESPASEGTKPARRYFPLDPRSIRVEQWTGLIIFFVLTVAALAGLAISYFSGGRPNWIWWTVAGGLGAASFVLLILAISWPKLEYRYTRWTWDADGLEIHRGVFWQHRITVPISRIQHVDVSQGPVQRQFGLGKVTVHTAGTQHAAIELSGIAYEAAVWLREQIIAGQGGQDAV
jgi:membrane protein YdbS with pleckstrin-like domain